MSDYCQQCDSQLGGLVGLCPKGKMITAICECCGLIWVDHKGNCLTTCACRKGRCAMGGKHPSMASLKRRR